MPVLAPENILESRQQTSFAGQRKINVCHVQVLPLLSGVQRVMLQLFSVLDRDRYQPSVICRNEGPLTEALRELSIPCILVPSLDRPVHPLHDLTAYRELRRVFDEQQFDIVHTHSSKPGILARVAAKRSGIRHVIHHVHGFAFNEFSPRHHRWFACSLLKVACCRRTSA
jgi:glycosyltransferase involved in cell wall biosynthesis